MKRLAIAVLLVVVAGPSLAAEEARRIDLRADGQPLLDLVERIAHQLDAGLIAEAGLDRRLSQAVSIRARDAAWAEVVALFADEYGLDLALVDGRLHVASVESALRERVELRLYDIRHLIAPVIDIPGPHLGAPAAGRHGAGIIPPIDEDGGIVASGDIIEIIEQVVAPRSWLDNPYASIDEWHGSLAIAQTPEVHDAVAALLEDLERVAARSIEARVWRIVSHELPDAVVIDAATWAEVGADDREAVANLFLRDEQRNHHHAGLQAATLTDLDMEWLTFDPIVDRVISGLVVDVDARATIGGVLSTVRLDRARPAAETATAEIDDAAGDPIATISLPRPSVEAIADTRLVPPGGAALYRLGDELWAIEYVVNEFRSED